MRRGRQREGGIAQARRERRQDERRLGIARAGSGGRPCSARTSSSGPATQSGRTKEPAGGDEHRRIGESRAARRRSSRRSRARRTREVGPRTGAERQDVGRPLARDAAAEAFADRPHLPLHVDGGQRQPLRREADVRPGRRSAVNPSASTCGTIQGRPANAMVWPAAVRLPGDRDERLQVTAAARECEDEVHRCSALKAAGEP